MQTITIESNITSQKLFETIFALYLFRDNKYFILSYDLFMLLKSRIELEICDKHKYIDNVIYQYQTFFKLIVDHNTKNSVINCSLSDIENISRYKKLNKITNKIKNY